MVKSAVFYAMRAGTRKGVKKGMGVDGNGWEGWELMGGMGIDGNNGN